MYINDVNWHHSHIRTNQMTPLGVNQYKEFFRIFTIEYRFFNSVKSFISNYLIFIDQPNRYIQLLNIYRQ